MQKEKSKGLYKEALNFIPGGVNSPVRAFKAVGGDPLFIKKADKSKIWDEDGNEYIELINSWGPMILGHNYAPVKAAVNEAIEHSLSFGAPCAYEVQIASLIVDMVPSIEKVRMVNSGTEAAMSAIRLARGYTGRDKFIKFEGCYHGHGDSFLIAAGSGAVTMGTPDSPGVTKGTAKDTLLAQYNNLDSVEALVKANPGSIAAIMLEPVAGNMGCVPPDPGFLSGLRQLCDHYSIVLIFDEVMTGFRLSKGGAQVIYNVIPDMTALGKIIGGGMPVGAYGGKAEIMDYVSPAGPVYQAGTLSGNPIAMAAGIAVLKELNMNPSIYEKIESSCRAIANGFRENLKALNLNYTINQVGSMLTLFFTDHVVSNFHDAKSSDLQMFGKYFNAMLDRGIYLAPSQFESLFISESISNDDIQHIVEANFEALKVIS